MVQGLIAITGHFERPRVKGLAKRAELILRENGVECRAADIKKREFNSREVELVLVVGGDGSLLRVARELEGEKAVLGIAAGKRSALMQVKEKGMKRALERLAKGKYRVERRMRLEAVADGKKRGLALNEVMLVNRQSGAIVDYELLVNGKEKGNGRADGCIIATPTGSSGHAYSAGGKRLKVGSNLVAIVPSNALGRRGKALYVPGKSRVVLKGLTKAGEHEAVLDGQPRFAVKRALAVRKGKDALFVKI